jgi:imidazolonepropionase-like amidohydrolase
MMLPLLFLAVSLGAATTGGDEAAGAAPLAFVGAHILPAVGPEIPNGVLVVQDGKITLVGALDATPIPASAEVRDASGLFVVPGFVDTHTHIGEPSGGDRSGPIQPEVRALDSIDVLAPGFARARAGGITTVNVMPGSGHLLSGQTVYLKLRRGSSIEDLAILGPTGKPAGGMKMANGTNSRGEPPFPGTRAKSAALVRERYVAAREYLRKLAEAPADETPDRDLGLEALGEVLRGERVVHHHTHRHDDILTVLRLREEFGLRVVLHHVSDAWRVADDIARAGVPCSLIVIDSPGGKLEARDMSWENGAALERAGAAVAFHTDDWITDSRLFLRSAGLAVRAGMSREKALAALTIEAARMLDLGDRVGSLEAGKDADLVLLSGDPFSVYTQVLETWVEGRRVFQRSDEHDRLHAVGGRGAGEELLPPCCEEEEER